MPILKAKKGEWEALRHLAESDRDLIFPLIECTTLALASQQPATDRLKEHLDALGRSLEIAGAKQRPFGLDSSILLPTFPKQARLLVNVCRKLTQKSLKIAPCILPAMVTDSPAEIAALSEYEQVILRIPVRACLSSQVQQLIKDAWNALGNKHVRLHVLLDMHDLAGGDANGIAASRKPYASAALGSNFVQSVILAGG